MGILNLATINHVAKNTKTDLIWPHLFWLSILATRQEMFVFEGIVRIAICFTSAAMTEFSGILAYTPLHGQ